MNNFLNKLPPSRGKKLIQLTHIEKNNKNNLEYAVSMNESSPSKEDLLHPSSSTIFDDVYLATSAKSAPEYRRSEDYDAMQSSDNCNVEENRKQNEEMQFSENESMLYEISQKVAHHNECENIPADITQEIKIIGFESLQYPSDTTSQYTEHTSNNNCEITSDDILSASFLYNTDCSVTECENDYGPDFNKLNKPTAKHSPSSEVNLDIMREYPTFAEMRNVEPAYLQLETDIGLVNDIEERDLDTFDDQCVKERQQCAENSLPDTDPDFEPDSWSNSDTDEEALNINLKQKKIKNKGFKAQKLEAKRESVDDMEAITDREEGEVEYPLNQEKQPKPLPNEKEAADDTDKSVRNIEEEEKVKKTRKRIRRPQDRERNIKKIKVNTGEAYTTKSGRTVLQKNIGEGCNDKCKLKCREKITGDDRKLLLGNFYSLTDINRKRDFISKLMEEINPRYVYKKHNSNRSPNNSYYLILCGLRLFF